MSCLVTRKVSDIRPWTEVYRQRTSNTHNLAIKYLESAPCLPQQHVPHTQVPPYDSYHADCAVCAKGYAPGLGRRCNECSGPSRGLAVAFSSMALVMVLVVVILGSVYLLQRVGAGPHREQNLVRRSWQGKLKHYRALLGKVIPLSTIRIVVVVLQIVIQVGAVQDKIESNSYFRHVAIVFKRICEGGQHIGLCKGTLNRQAQTIACSCFSSTTKRLS